MTHLRFFCNARSLFLSVLLLSSLGLQAQLAGVENLAAGQPVDASGPLWTGFDASGLADGNPATFAHPLDDSGLLGFYFEVDLGKTYRLEQILIRNRGDGCCPERLSHYGVEIYADNGGETGALNWSALIRADGSNSGVSGVDRVSGDLHKAGTFGGRFIRVVNRGGAAYSPQLAEIEVYGGQTPVIRLFEAEKDTLRAGEGGTLRWEIANATQASMSSGIGPVGVTQGTVAIRPLVTTLYELTASNEAGSTTVRLRVGVDVVLAPPRLTEFVAENTAGLRDEDGEFSDWIEVQNTNEFGLELEGFYLTDDAAELSKWRVPSFRIPAGGFFVIYASGKDRQKPGSQFHTNFKLSGGGDYLGLVDRDGRTVLQQFPAEYPATKNYPGQVRNLSYGIDSGGRVGFMRPPTPLGTNGVTVPGFVADTKFSRDRGFYDTNFTVTLSTATPGAMVRYTTNRTLPTSSSGTIYTGPIEITGTTILRAAAFKEALASTDVDTQTYLFPTNVINSSVMRRSITTNVVYQSQMKAGLLELPSISLVTTATINGSIEVKTSFEWLRSDGGESIQADCGVRLYGGAYTDFAKKSFRIYFRKEFGISKLKYPLFAGHEHGLAVAEEFDQLELRSGSHDMEMRGFYMSNICTDDTLLEMGRLNPHGRFVHLYLNGIYWGIYHLRERWGAAMHQQYFGGSSTNYESINGNLNVGGWSDGTVYDGDGSVWKKIKSLRSDYQAIRSWLDVPQFTDYMIMWLFGGSEDEYRCVGPTVPGSGFKFYLNDADGWFCVPNYCAAGNRTGRGAPGKQSGDGPGSLFSMLLKQGDPDYVTLVADRIHAALFSSGALTPGRVAARLTHRTDQIDRAFLAESARWNYLTPAAWLTRRNSVLTSWLPNRTAELVGQLRSAGIYPSLSAPILSKQGGSVNEGFALRFLGPPGATIWYTLDGSDPRLPGGAIAPGALRYSTGGSTEVLIPSGASWRWFTDAVGLGASDIVAGHASWTVAQWKHPDFADKIWKEGRAQLGYGEGDEASVIPFGEANNKWVTSYFRHRFTLTNITGITELLLGLKRDDGAIVYLNGQEAARMSMRGGAVIGTTPAESAADDGQSFSTISISPGRLRLGTNVVAVELHQSTPTTSDASFDLELGITRSGAAQGDLMTLSKSTAIKSRAQNGSNWSALNEAFFQIGPAAVAAGDVVVSELDFNPLGEDGSESLVLANISEHAVDLRGVRFTEGITFAFSSYRPMILAPGQRLILANDLFKFQQRHGIDIPVEGVFRGKLSNKGERITFVDATGTLSRSFHYETRAPWPEGADGGGFSLVLAHLDLGLDNPNAWRTSATTNSLPGRVDEVAFVGNPTEDIDGDGLPALLEYALGTSDRDPVSGPSALRGAWIGEKDFGLSFNRNLRTRGVVLSVESSSDLRGWSAAELKSTQTTGAGLAVETWGVADRGQPAVFFRVRVNRAL